MSNRDPFESLKGRMPEGEDRTPRTPVSQSSTGRPNIHIDNNAWPDSPPPDGDIPDPKFDILRMDMMLRGPGNIQVSSLGQGIGLTGTALIQSWREEEKRRSK